MSVRSTLVSGVVLVAFLLIYPNEASLVSTSSARLPLSLSAVVNDLETEGASQVMRACLITSKGVTSAERKALLQSIFGVEDDFKAFGTKQGEGALAIANPGPSASVAEVASTAVACGGTILFLPNSIDLARGEGLFDYLAPAMEQLLAASEKRSLIVVAPQSARQQLQQAAASILPNLVQPRGERPAKVLEDVFQSVEYVSSPAEVAAKLQATPACAPKEAASAIIASAKALSLATQSPLSSKDLAAARTLGPAAKTALESALSTVQDMLKQTPLVTNFGELADAAVKRTLQELPTTITSPLAQRIKTRLHDELYSELGDIFEDQLDVLSEASFESFRRDLSQLRVSPNLAQDMNDVVNKCIADFGRACQKMVAKGSKTWSTMAARTTFATKLKEFCKERLLVAKASGQYRPAPRKGVTVGLHWLLPKPFGNDFRQEPWMVHAMDNMVYVPKDKITDVAPGEVKSGDWRDKIVPSPSARDMVYMQ